MARLIERPETARAGCIPPDRPGTTPPKAVACVIGDMDLVAPRWRHAVPCVMTTRPNDPDRYSRRLAGTLDGMNAWEQPEEFVERLVRFASSQPEPPVLFYQGDGDLLLVSRHRERLSRFFRFLIPDPVLVEDLVHKGRFQRLAERLGLPVPRACVVSPHGGGGAGDMGLQFPVIVKPLLRRRDILFRPIAGAGKAVQANTPSDLQRLLGRLADLNVDVIVQELISGPETRIESYHVYVDEHGELVGDFTGRKIRTYPLAYGYSTAVVITDIPVIAALGRELVRRLNFRSGVAKFDFKRGSDGQPYLLEVNPRFNLWHHAGAVAGVNLPWLVYADLLGIPRPHQPRARSGVRWCRLRQDARAARASGIPLLNWLPWALSVETTSGLALDDPLPLLLRVVPPAHRVVRALAHRRTSRASPTVR
jgi:predicted ATP-grasp superfamily ATP-dependent carboligase